MPDCFLSGAVCSGLKLRLDAQGLRDPYRAAPGQRYLGSEHRQQGHAPEHQYEREAALVSRTAKNPV
jgi:hypothetical protein